MKKAVCLILSLVLLVSLTACGHTQEEIQENISTNELVLSDQGSSVTEEETPQPEISMKEGNRMNIQVGDQLFTAVLYDNPSTKAFREKLPLTLDMGDMNGNEKFFFFSESLPSNSEGIGNINVGDLMLYGTDCLVLFYEAFSTSYHYTPLGYIENPRGLAKVLGENRVEISFQMT